MELTYLNHEDFNVDVDFFKPFIENLLGRIEPIEGLLNVVFVNDTYIKALNKTYRDKDKPTDVLSFNYEHEHSDLGGEVYISVETAERQAKEHGFTFSEELIKLIVHGILHVHGFDHVEEEDYKEMYAIEKAVLGRVAGEYISEE